MANHVYRRDRATAPHDLTTQPQRRYAPTHVEEPDRTGRFLTPKDKTRHPEPDQTIPETGSVDRGSDISGGMVA